MASNPIVMVELDSKTPHCLKTFCHLRFLISWVFEFWWIASIWTSCCWKETTQNAFTQRRNLTSEPTTSYTGLLISRLGLGVIEYHKQNFHHPAASQVINTNVVLL